MKSSSLAILPKLNAQFHKYFPKRLLQALWQQAQPKAYHYALLPWALLQALWLAYLTRTSGLRDLTQRHGELLGTDNFSSLSPALARPVFAAFATLCRARLERHWTPQAGELVPIDSMALTLPKTQRHGCQKFNDKTVGGGVIWALALGGGRRVCPVKILTIVEGAWSDAKQLSALPLLAVGPVYLMDRGFYALELLARWLGAGVHFIVRAKRGNLVYAPVCELSAPRHIGPLTLEWDGLAWMGGAKAKAHPVVRLLKARLASGEELLLVTDQWLWSAERVLAAYRQRWQIERFHKVLKDALGLAHLYNFSQSGLALQIEAVLLLALLLYLAQEPSAGQRVVDVLRQAVRQARAALGLGTPWRRNCNTVTHAKKQKKTGQGVWGNAKKNIKR